MDWELCGYVASGLVLAAFYMKDMVPLRLAALASNLAFIAYGLALGLTPIWILHALLVPLNGYRLIEAARLRAKIATRNVHTTLHRPRRTTGEHHDTSAPCSSQAVLNRSRSRRGPRREDGASDPVWLAIGPVRPNRIQSETNWL